MAKYISENSRAKRRKQQKARRMAMYSTIAIFILVISFVIVKVIEIFKNDEKDIPLLDNSGTENITDDNIVTNDIVIGPNITDIELEKVRPDINILRTTSNGRVELNYFNDAIFLGDSLADGFKVYGAWMNLKNTTATYLTQQGTTPRTFLQPGVMVDAGEGPVDVWATISQKQPGKIYITLGTNALMGMDPEEFIDGYYKLIDKIKDTSPNTIIYVTTITPTTEKKATQEPRLSYDRIYQSNQLIAKMCNEKGLMLINLYDVMKNDKGYLNEDIAASDGYHLTKTGYSMWFDYLITHTKYSPNSPYIPGSPYYLEPKSEQEN